ncbi:MAG: DUF992 domain-containing protein [Pseudomonadota bacterium]|nr:DUF992 domain-containing protein [Pseudomonadota bacterium]
MNFSLFPPARAALLGAALIGLTATAPSATPVQSGVLECNVAPGIGFIIGSSKSISCVFHPARGRPEFYTGTINRIGVDIGATGPGQFAWGVFTAGPSGRRYALAGDYAGPGVGFALGAGLSANTLVGGNGDSISLQPLSLGTSAGLNLSAGIGALTLLPVAAGPPRRHGHHG